MSAAWQSRVSAYGRLIAACSLALLVPLLLPLVTGQSIDELKVEATAPTEAKPGDVIRTFVGGRDAGAVLRGLRLTMGYTGLYAAQVLDPRDRVTERLSGLTWGR